MKYLIAAAVLAASLGTGPAMAQDPTWNGVAFDINGQPGVVFGAATEADAQQQSLAKCVGDNCAVLFATQLPCVAIASTLEGGGYYAWAQGAVKDGTEMIAMGYCINGGFPGCKSVVLQCATDTATTPAQPKIKTKG